MDTKKSNEKFLKLLDEASNDFKLSTLFIVVLLGTVAMLTYLIIT